MMESNQVESGFGRWRVPMVGVVGTLLVAVAPLNAVLDRSFHTPLSGYVPGGLAWGILTPEEFVAFTAVLVGLTLATLLVIFGLVRYLASGAVGNLQIVAVGCLAWLLLLFVQDIPNGWVADRLGIWEYSGTDISNFAYPIIFALFVIIGALTTQTRNSDALKEELDDVI